jgi:hypothetical protein
MILSLLGLDFRKVTKNRAESSGYAVLGAHCIEPLEHSFPGFEFILCTSMCCSIFLYQTLVSVDIFLLVV